MIKWFLSLFKPTKKKAAAAATGVTAISLAVSLIMPWEGRELKAYRDIVGVWTICDGDTNNVRPGQVATVQECDDRLAVNVKKYNDYLTDMVGRPMPAEVEAAFTSWIYNVGPGNAKTSTLVRYAREGKWLEACNQLPRWNRAGGKVVRGLVNRRAAELELCLKGAK